MKRTRLILLISILASTVAFMDGSIVNVALPAISHDFGGGLVIQQWVVDAYLVTLGALMLIAGSLADLFGRAKIMVIGLIWFGLASLLCAIAPTSAFLIIARALQGVAGALLVPSSLALIMSAMPKQSRAKAIGTWTAWTGISFLIGPAIGGILVDLGSWRWVFVLNVIPIGITLWLLARLKLQESRSSAKLDFVGAILCTVGLGDIVYALIEQSRLGWTDPLIYSTFIVGIISLIAFVQYERRVSEPMMPISLFKHRNFTVGNLSTLTMYAALSMASFVIVIFVQQVGGYTATMAGLTLIPESIIMFFLAARFGALADKYGPRVFMAVGQLIVAAGFLEMLLVDESANYLVLLPGILLFGLGLAVTVAPLTSAVLSAISEQRSGIASAVNNAIARIAGLIAIAALGPIVGTAIGLDGFHNALIIMAILMIIGGVVAAIGIKNPERVKPAIFPETLS
ncbi:MAG: MFS transporter [Candidatus Saccharimonas sp.]